MRIPIFILVATSAGPVWAQSAEVPNTPADTTAVEVVPVEAVTPTPVPTDAVPAPVENAPPIVVPTPATEPAAEAADTEEDALSSGGDEVADDVEAVEEEDDDWDTAGPVDTSVQISGALQASSRATFYDTSVLPDGTVIDDDYQFQLEHTHIKFGGDLSNKLSWEVTPCLTHQNDFSVLNAHFNYKVANEFNITFGRFLLPFGQFNLRSLPGVYSTVSRPLLYQSHEDRMVTFGNLTPRNFIFTPRDDTGVRLTGNRWLGDTVQLSYAAYVTNGLRGNSDNHARFWDDNNDAKQFGGRGSASYNGTKLSAGVGGSYLQNKYEDNPETGTGLDQYAWALDGVLSYSYEPGKKITVRGEYVDTSREIIPTDELLQGDESTQGAYVAVEGDLPASLVKGLSAYYQYDWLSQTTPIAQLNEQFRDNEVAMTRHIVGLSKLLEEHLLVRLEYGVWLTPSGAPDAQRVSAQTIVTF